MAQLQQVRHGGNGEERILSVNSLPSAASHRSTSVARDVNYPVLRVVSPSTAGRKPDPRSCDTMFHLSPEAGRVIPSRSGTSATVALSQPLSWWKTN